MGARPPRGRRRNGVHGQEGPNIVSSVTTELSKWIADLRLEDVPDEVRERAKLITADITGIALRGRNDSESTPPLIAGVEALDLATGRFRVIGDSHSYSATGATLINATCAHSLELDDTFSLRALHASCLVVPAALAAAQMVNADGKQLLLGIVAGLEAMCRIGLGRNPGVPLSFHTTPTTGAFGATAAAAAVLGLTPEQTEHAFGIVLSNTSGNIQFLTNGAWTKRVQIGFGSSAGVTAAALAREGYTGSAEALEGQHGFYALFAEGKADPSRVVEDLGSVWQIMEIAFKPHSSCRGTHAAIDAAIDLRNTYDIDFADIDLVTVGLPRSPIDLIDVLASPNRLDPTTHVNGQFSITFTVATALKIGRLGLDDYADQFWASDVRDVMSRMEVFEDFDAKMPKAGTSAGSVKVRLKDGAEHHRLVTIPKGEPENMMSPEEIKHKFTDLVHPFLTPDRVEALYECILNLERLTSVADYFDLATPNA